MLLCLVFSPLLCFCSFRWVTPCFRLGSRGARRARVCSARDATDERMLRTHKPAKRRKGHVTRFANMSLKGRRLNSAKPTTSIGNSLASEFPDPGCRSVQTQLASSGLRSTHSLRSLHARDLPAAHRGVGDGGGTKLLFVFSSFWSAALCLGERRARSLSLHTHRVAPLITSKPTTRARPQKKRRVFRTPNASYRCTCDRLAASISAHSHSLVPPSNWQRRSPDGCQNQGGGTKVLHTLKLPGLKGVKREFV